MKHYPREGGVTNVVSSIFYLPLDILYGFLDLFFYSLKIILFFVIFFLTVLFVYQFLKSNFLERYNTDNIDQLKFSLDLSIVKNVFKNFINWLNRI